MLMWMHLRDDTAFRLERLAQRDHRPREDLVAEAVEIYLARQEKETDLRQPGRDQAVRGKGDFVP